MSCVLDGAPQPLVFHLHPFARCCSQKCCLLRRKPRSQSSGNKARIVSVCSSSRCPSFSFPLRSLPLPLLLLFQLLLPSPFIFSLPAGTGSRFTFPRGWGQLSRAFPCFPNPAERKRPLKGFISRDSSSFPGQSPPLSSWEQLPASGMFPCEGSVLLRSPCPGRVTWRLSPPWGWSQVCPEGEDEQG